MVSWQISQSRAKLVDQLKAMGYRVKECLLSPIQFGIPNHRLRYYLMARRISTEPVEQNLPLFTTWPFSGQDDHEQVELPQLSHFLEKQADLEEKYTVPPKHILKRHRFRFGKDWIMTWCRCRPLSFWHSLAGRYRPSIRSTNLMYHQGRSNCLLSLSFFDSTSHRSL